MADIILVKSQEIAIGTTANSVSNAALVRVMNVASALRKVTVRDSANNILGSITLGATGDDSSVEFIKKDFTDTIEANTGTSDILATSIGFY
jgi:hypothetical protein